MSVNIDLLPRGTTQVSDTPTTKKHDAQCLRDTALTVETFAYSAAGNLPGSLVAHLMCISAELERLANRIERDSSQT